MSNNKPDPIDALHAALLNSKLGISGAARAIGRSPGGLHNKFCETSESGIMAREALALSDVIQSDAYVDAVCAYFGGVFFRLPEGLAGDDDVMGAYLEIIKRMGELSSRFIAARADGIVDPGEFGQIRNDAYSIMSALNTYLAELETMVRTIPAPIQMRGPSGR